MQNTWYSVLAATKNCRLKTGNVSVAVANETLEVRIIIDGVTYTGAQAAIAGTIYRFFVDRTGAIGYAADNTINAFMVEGRSIAIDARKTTALGAGALTARVIYAKW